MVDAGVVVQCSDPACDVVTTGVCVDRNAPLATCPKFGRPLSADSRGGEASRTKSAIRLRSGRALGPTAVDLMLRKRPARFIAIIGDSFAGKTTLISAIYDRFLRGPFCGLDFVASETLVEFEIKTYYSRAESGLEHPSMPRTSRQDGLLYYHLAVSKDGKRNDLLFSDRAGEVYKEARDNSDEVKSLSEVPQADHVLLLADGGKLANPTNRAETFQGARQLLRVLLDNGGLSEGSRVQLVITKADQVAQAMDAAALDTAIKDFETRLTRDFGGRLATLTYWRIAARDPRGRLMPAQGVAELMQEWLTDQPQLTLEAMPIGITPQSEFDRLMLRTPEVA